MEGLQLADLRALWGLIIPLFVVIYLAFLRKHFGRMTANVTEKTAAELAPRLAALGLQRFTPPPDPTKPATVPTTAYFTGIWRGWPAGLTIGEDARLVAVVSSQGFTSRYGREFWVGEGLWGPPLGVHDRGVDHYDKVNTATLPQPDVPTGNPAFDARFRVRCDDPNFARNVVTPELQAQLLAWPQFIMLVMLEGRVYCDLDHPAGDIALQQPAAYLDFAVGLAYCAARWAERLQGAAPRR